MSETNQSSLISRIGLIILILSLVFWAFLPVVPFLPLSAGRRAAIGGVTFVIAEVAFWVGAIMAGKEIVTRFKSWFSPKRLWAKIRERSE